MALDDAIVPKSLYLGVAALPSCQSSSAGSRLEMGTRRVAAMVLLDDRRTAREMCLDSGLFCCGQVGTSGTDDAATSSRCLSPREMGVVLKVQVWVGVRLWWRYARALFARPQSWQKLLIRSRRVDSPL